MEPVNQHTSEAVQERTAVVVEKDGVFQDLKEETLNATLDAEETKNYRTIIQVVYHDSNKQPSPVEASFPTTLQELERNIAAADALAPYTNPSGSCLGKRKGNDEEVACPVKFSRNSPCFERPSNASSSEKDLIEIDCSRAQSSQAESTEHLDPSIEKQSKNTTTRPSSCKKLRPCYRYGNYHSYYGYRVGGGVAGVDDPRLSALRPEWFVGKTLVDVGCNEGLLTLRLTARHLCKSVMGVDIDQFLINKAVRHLCQARSELSSWVRSKAAPSSQATLNWSGPDESWKPTAAVAALRQVKFKCANFVENETDLTPGSVDVVLCLSVSKWIHLNWGDEGLRKLFDKVFATLAPGGLFILEPQPWKSYRQAMRKQDMPAEVKNNITQLRIRPDHFSNILLQEVGFKSVEMLEPPSGSTKGFDRPLTLYWKE